MKKVAVNNLIELDLDWAMAKALGYEVTISTGKDRFSRLSDEERADAMYAEFVKNSPPRVYWNNPTKHTPCPAFSTNWAYSGPIIEHMFHAGFELRQGEPEAGNQRAWARIRDGKYYSAETPLIAAIRCYVASKLGDEIEIPDELS